MPGVLPLLVLLVILTGNVMARAAEQDGDPELILVLVGDVNMNRTGRKVAPEGIRLNTGLVSFRDLFRLVAPFIDGDINFCNLETTVMDRNDIPMVQKSYNFRSHPDSLRALRRLGFNLLSIANNHIYDYGQEGIAETLRWIETVAREEGAIHFAGAHTQRELVERPSVFQIRGIRVAFMALSAWGRPRGSSGGTANAWRPQQALASLRDTPADLRILSVHAGVEMSSRPNRQQRQLARMAIDDYGVHVVVGHHPHVVQGIERYGGGFIFYSLGNFVMRGDIGRSADRKRRHLRDFGLLARLTLRITKDGPRFREVQVIPFTDMHLVSRPFGDPEDAGKRVNAVNLLSTPDYLSGTGEAITFLFVQDRGIWRAQDLNQDAN